jgi:hypothetical protein
MPGNLFPFVNHTYSTYQVSPIQKVKNHHCCGGWDHGIKNQMAKVEFLQYIIEQINKSTKNYVTRKKFYILGKEFENYSKQTIHNLIIYFLIFLLP